jgi:hypothetical protein
VCLGSPYEVHGGPPPRAELVQLSRLFLAAPGPQLSPDDATAPPSPGAAAALVRVLWDILPAATPAAAGGVNAGSRSVVEAIVGVKLLLCLTRAWFASDAGPGLPEWLENWAPRLVARIICDDAGSSEGQPGEQARGLLSCAALELGIGLLSVEHYRLRLQRAFALVLAHRSAAPGFFQQLRCRLRRAEREDASLGAMYKEMQALSGQAAAGPLPEFFYFDRSACRQSLAAHELAVSAGREDCHSLADEEIRSNHVELVLGFTQVT